MDFFEVGIHHLQRIFEFMISNVQDTPFRNQNLSSKGHIPKPLVRVQIVLFTGVAFGADDYGLPSIDTWRMAGLAANPAEYGVNAGLYEPQRDAPCFCTQVILKKQCHCFISNSMPTDQSPVQFFVPSDY